MKNYKELVNELPTKTVVFAFGRFNPPTLGHELLIKVVRKLASQRKADHVVFASATQDAKKNPLEVSKKVQYLELLFPNTRFAPANKDIRTFLEAAVSLNKRYRNLVMVAGSDRVHEFEKILKQYNGKAFKFDTIEVVSAGSRDPDADDASGMSGTKMRSLASKGDYFQFKRGLPTTVRDIDGKRLMNDIRIGMGLEPIKEQINLVKDTIREQYFRGEIFLEGEIVESDNTVYKIIKRGSNHLLLQDETGSKVSKWVQDVQLTEREYMSQENLLNEDDQKAGLTVGAGAKTAENQRKVAELKAKQAKQIEDVKERQTREMDTARTNMKTQNEDKKYSIPKSLMSLGDFRKTLKMGAKPVTDAGEQSAVENGIIGDTHLASDGKHGLRHQKIKHHLGEASAAAKLQKAFQREQERIAAERKAGEELLKKPVKEETVLEGNGYDDNRTGFAKKPREDDEGHAPTKFKAKSTMDRPHTVHIDGKPWKKFDNGHQAHAAAKTLTAKGKKATAIAHFREETEDQQDTRKAQLKRFKDQASGAKLDPVTEAAYAGLEKEDKPGKVKTAIVKTHPKAVEVETVEGWKDEKKPVKEGTEDQLEFDFEEINESEFDALIESLTDEDILEAYEDSELAIVDEETGEELEAVSEEAEYDTPALMEVLSRMERVKAKARMRRTKAKRERAEKIALRHFSSTPVANRRARRLSVSLLKKRLMKGVNPAKASVGQKENMERYIAQHRKVVDRLSARMVTKVRQTEKKRLSHRKFTK
jgi:phosphopantetheine adenylyltransferase